jgi:hypothetical protein
MDDSDEAQINESPKLNPQEITTQAVPVMSWMGLS